MSPCFSLTVAEASDPRLNRVGDFNRIKRCVGFGLASNDARVALSLRYCRHKRLAYRLVSQLRDTITESFDLESTDR